MVASKVLLATAALAGAAAASAIPATNKLENFNKGRATVQQVPRANYEANGVLSMYKTYLKFGAAIPDWLYAAVEQRTGKKLKRDEGSAVATPIDTYDDAYTVPVS